MPNKNWTGPNWKWPKTWRWLWNCCWDKMKSQENIESSSDDLMQSEALKSWGWQSIWRWLWAGMWRWRWRGFGNNTKWSN